MDKKDKDLEFIRGMEKLKAADVKAPGYTSDLDKDIVRVKGSKAPSDVIGKIKGVTEHINTKGGSPILSGESFMEKIAKARGLRSAGKKVLGVLPMAGAIGAALQGDPAMAAEELAGDIPVAGQIYEAIKPTASGNPEEERMMLAEDQARKNYDKSPARLAKLKALMGRK